MLSEKTELREFSDIIAQSHSKGLYERAAARGTSLVEHDAVDSFIFYLEALDVLSADIDDEIDLGGQLSQLCRGRWKDLPL